jgi:hypothetical protein
MTRFVISVRCHDYIDVRQTNTNRVLEKSYTVDSVSEGTEWLKYNNGGLCRLLSVYNVGDLEVLEVALEGGKFDISFILTTKLTLGRSLFTSISCSSITYTTLKVIRTQRAEECFLKRRSEDWFSEDSRE